MGFNSAFKGLISSGKKKTNLRLLAVLQKAVLYVCLNKFPQGLYVFYPNLKIFRHLNVLPQIFKSCLLKGKIQLFNTEVNTSRSPRRLKFLRLLLKFWGHSREMIYVTILEPRVFRCLLHALTHTHTHTHYIY
jgi:hypothetical protein